MDINKYIDNLYRYVETPFQYKLDDNVLRVYIDNEEYYDYNYTKRTVEMCERANRVDIGNWPTIKISNLNFAMLLRNHFNKRSYEKMPKELESCDSLDTLQNIISCYVKNNNYSIGSVKEGKISIVKDEKYTILFCYKNVEHVIDSDLDCEYIFGRFFYELLYLNSFLENLKIYETVFGEKFANDEIIDLIGY